MKKIVLIGLVLLVAVLASGCASYSTKALNTAQIDESKLVKDSGNDISVIAFPILTEKDSKDYFDKNLIDKGVVAVYLNILNIAGDVEFVNSTLLVQPGNKELVLLSMEQVYKEVRREYVGKAAFWMLFAYVGTPISAAHTKIVNNRIEEDIQTKILKLGNIKSKESTQGFLWFKLPDDAMEQNVRLILKLTFKRNDKLIVKNLSFPAPKSD